MNVFELIALVGASLGGACVGSRVAGEAGAVLGLVAGPGLIFALSWVLSRKKRSTVDQRKWVLLLLVRPNVYKAQLRAVLCRRVSGH